jgi:hypothetical protein
MKRVRTARPTKRANLVAHIKDISAKGTSIRQDNALDHVEHALRHEGNAVDKITKGARIHP